MRNTLQYTVDADHVHAHQRLGRERGIVALIAERYEQIRAEAGVEIAQRVWKDSRRALRQATDHHRTFHGGENA